MRVLSQLEPGLIWQYFEEICRIPRISKNEGLIRKYLIEFAKKNSLVSKEDKVGNILIVREASPGMENRKTVVLQSHMDMVGEKNADHPHNWLTDPIIPVVKGEWVTASGTTLGADDGIGIASQLAILTDSNLKCGRIECLFTVDEESGMTGAINLSPDFFTGRTLINLDSEDEGILFIGCAGGIDTVGVMHYTPVSTGDGKKAFEIAVTGLHGGHSGDEIHKGYGNAVKIMNSLLESIYGKHQMAIAAFDGGNLRNAIPREAFSTIVVNINDSAFITGLVEEYTTGIAREYINLEKDLKITVREAPLPSTVIDDRSCKNFMDLISCTPHGVIAWSKEMADLVETSTNLASAKIEPGNIIKIVTTQRSSLENSKYEIAEVVEKCMTESGAEVTHSEGYPGWKPDIRSEILRITKQSYRNLFGKDPQVRAIHAGLECGLIYQKINDIDMISFGPTIKGAHTPEEMIEVKTAKMFWDLLTDVLKNIPGN